MGELAGELPPKVPPAPSVQLIRSEDNQPPGCLPARQPRLRRAQITQQPGNRLPGIDIVHGHQGDRVPRAHAGLPA
jgi:hypothetical protein